MSDTKDETSDAPLELPMPGPDGLYEMHALDGLVGKTVRVGPLEGVVYLAGVGYSGREAWVRVQVGDGPNVRDVMLASMPPFGWAPVVVAPVPTRTRPELKRKVISYLHRRAEQLGRTENP